MGRVPGSVSAAVAVGKADLGIGPAVGGAEISIRCAWLRIFVTRPVVAGVVDVIRKCPAVRLRTGQHFVTIRVGSRLDVVPIVVPRIRIIIKAGNGFALFGKPGQLVEIVAETRQFQRVSMQVREVGCDHLAFDVVPGTGADAVARIDGRLSRPACVLR